MTERRAEGADLLSAAAAGALVLPASLNVCVVGVGYVGAVTAASLARDGHRVIAVDTDPAKNAALASGRSPVIEPGLDGLVASGLAAGRLTPSPDLAAGIHQTEISLVCVGTPARPDGSLDTRYIERVANDIGAALASAPHFHSVVVRSTLLPGTMKAIVAPLLERASGRTCGVDFGLGYYPEFLREGAALADYDSAGMVVFGAADPLTRERMLRLLPADAPRPHVLELDEAEAVKYVSNAWHSVKISFANEIGGICGAFGLDSHRIMDVICSDQRLNTSRAYLKPGFAFGGSCLPKDLSALRHQAQAKGASTLMLEAAQAINQRQLERALGLIRDAAPRRVGLIGLTFKPETDDLRGSPMVELARALIDEDVDVLAFDRNVEPAKLTGANLAHMRARLPEAPELLKSDLNAVVAACDLLVLSDPTVGLRAFELSQDHHLIVDLVRVSPELRTGGRYVGLSW